MNIFSSLFAFWPLYGIVAILLTAVTVFKALDSEHSATGASSGVSGYTKRDSVMNKSEMAFFFELKKQIPAEYHVFPNMRIADFIDANNGKGFYNRRNKILPKHIDFLICDKYFKPVIAIEVNGSSHRRADRIERDALVTQIFTEAKLPLEFVDVGSNFEQSVSRIKSYLSS